MYFLWYFAELGSTTSQFRFRIDRWNCLYQPIYSGCLHTNFRPDPLAKADHSHRPHHPTPPHPKPRLAFFIQHKDTKTQRTQRALFKSKAQMMKSILPQFNAKTQRHKAGLIAERWLKRLIGLYSTQRHKDTKRVIFLTQRNHKRSKHLCVLCFFCGFFALKK